MNFLPLAPTGQTPVRVLTIAGTDSGGGAGIQADSRTMALCGVHALVAVAAVTVQNSVGVSGFHEIPTEIVAAQVRSVAGDIGVGGATLATELLRANLLDELLIFTHPAILGAGRPLFDAHDEPIELDLLEHATFEDSVTLHRYSIRGAT